MNRSDAMTVVFSAKKGTLGISFSGEPFTWENDRDAAMKLWRSLEQRPGAEAFTAASGNECIRFESTPLGFEPVFD